MGGVKSVHSARSTRLIRPLSLSPCVGNINEMRHVMTAVYALHIETARAALLAEMLRFVLTTSLVQFAFLRVD